jgi:flagellar basal-body rod modification protein FlgD
MVIPVLPLVGAISSAISAVKEAVTPSASSPTKLGKDDFLKLLVAQLKNQDPMSPLANDQMLAQSAAFSQVEALQNIQQTLDASSKGSSAAALGASTGLLGRPVTATSATFTFAGATTTLPFTLDAPVSSAVAEISDASGNVVAHIALGARAAGAQSVDLSAGTTKTPLGAGQYRYRILADDGTGRATPLAAIAGVVTGVSLDNGTPVLAIGSRKISLADVAAVGTPTAQGGS